MIGAWMDGTLPDGIEDYLSRQSGSVKVDPVLHVLRDAVADARFADQVREQIPTPDAMRQEAEKLAADLLSVRERLLTLNPYLQAHADAYIWRTWRSTTANTVKGVEGDLRELARALSVPIPPAKRGRRRKHTNDEALGTLAAAIEANSRLGAANARDLAADLLRRCGIDMPKSERQHRRKAKHKPDRT